MENTNGCAATVMTIITSIITVSENIVVKLQPLGTYDERPAGTAFIGSDNSYGLILVGSYSYHVWVHDRTLDTALSEEILVDNLACPERTQATLNFRQILPFK